MHVNVKLVSPVPNVTKNVILDSLVSDAYKNAFVKMGPIVMLNLELASVKLAGMELTVKNRVLMVIGVRNVKKFVLALKMVPNVITFPVNASVVLVITVITVMNYALLGLLEAVVRKSVFVELGQTTVIPLTAVASVSPVIRDLCATKNVQVADGVKIV